VEGPTSSWGLRNRITCLTIQEHDDDELLNKHRLLHITHDWSHDRRSVHVLHQIIFLHLLLHSYTNRNVNLTLRPAAIWLCHFVLRTQCSAVSAASIHAPQRTHHPSTMTAMATKHDLLNHSHSAYCTRWVRKKAIK
jgi:hypothetical protein